MGYCILLAKLTCMPQKKLKMEFLPDHLVDLLDSPDQASSVEEDNPNKEIDVQSVNKARKFRLTRSVGFLGLLLKVLHETDVIGNKPVRQHAEIAASVFTTIKGKDILPLSLKGKYDKPTAKELERFIDWLREVLAICKQWKKEIDVKNT